FLLFALFYMAHCEEGARLLASKSLLNRYAVEDWTLQYIIYTADSSAALYMELSDDSFHPPPPPRPKDFGTVFVMFDVKWLQIARNVSHTVVLRPLEAAYFTSATIAYLAQEGGEVGFMSAPGQGGILAQREFDGRFLPHFI
ncbi:SSRB protein, partial [Spizaetus tyrannus]|nr:SSRB protein [Spizaetus tyrannus]